MTSSTFDHLSATSIGMFLRCQEQFRFRYIEGIKIPPAGAVIMGTAYHEAVSEDLRKKQAEETPLGLDDVKDIFRSAFEREVDSAEEGIDWREDAPGSLIDDGVKLVEDYHQAVLPAINPVYVEAGFRYEVGDGLPAVVGFIDLIHRTESGLVIVDHKTSARRGGLEKYALQLETYSIGMEKDYGESPKRAEIHQAVRKKQVYVEPMEIPRTGALERIVSSMCRAINHGIFTPSGYGTWVCSEKWCGYWKICMGKK